MRPLALSLALWTVALAPHRANAQSDSTSAGVPRAERRASALGLAAIGAFTLHAGGAAVQRGYRAGSLGSTLDLGYLGHRRVRLLADLSYLLTAPRTEFVEAEGQRYRDVFRDLSGHLALALHATDPARRLSPYVLGGAGVHILSSSFGSFAIDARYNSNNFGLLGAVGARLRLGAGQRHAMQLEVRGAAARQVRRAAIHLGYARLFNDLALRH